MVSQLFSAFLWSVAGFVVGFFTCWVSVKVAEVEANRFEVRHMKDTKSVRQLDVLRVVVGVLLLLLVALSGYRYYVATECQTDYNLVVAEALNQRSDAQRLEGEAQIALLTASLGPDRAAAARATRDYIEAIAELERVRASNPLPPPPDCGSFR